MRFTHFTITQEGKFIGSSAVLQQAVIAAIPSAFFFSAPAVRVLPNCNLLFHYTAV